MGYTHYFKQEKAVKKEAWENFSKDAQILMDYAQTQLGIVLMSDDSTGVLINKNRVNINGDATKDLDHETFYLQRAKLADFNFCKTAAKPYDLVVCSLLLLANEHSNGSYNISSDGDVNDWQESMKLNAELFKKAYHLPESVDNSERAKEVIAELDDYVAKYNLKKDLEIELNKEINPEVNKTVSKKRI